MFFALSSLVLRMAVSEKCHLLCKTLLNVISFFLIGYYNARCYFHSLCDDCVELSSSAFPLSCESFLISHTFLQYQNVLTSR